MPGIVVNVWLYGPLNSQKDQGRHHTYGKK